MELCSIASGSSGNCICVGSDDCHVLIDAGISGKRIENGLNSIDLKTADMQGILITHEHIDHIAGLGVIARRYGIPMYATGETVDAILHTKTVGKIDEALFQVIEPERSLQSVILRSNRCPSPMMRQIRLPTRSDSRKRTRQL